ncbi:MAG: putative 2OG-Fe(II) oxygenase [Sphingopyxis sp.]|uniref:2OG-Fe(II) oxygenase family protein n=1 Tax=Sphingopyxis sp. TaxID=1908224 RepID=UPI002ABC7E79|nr:putative 2OG-Fe(II) oxygenase [Sphingopyxis sp.]MDZ3831769.1 putative 2OG-Fe(II) oxygenase [Sphingopyxis sp.]
MIQPDGVSDPEAVINAALDARDAGRGADMLPSLRAALDRHPRNARLWQTMGVVYRALDESAAAIDAFAEAARLAPGEIKSVYGVAQASLEAGRPATALFERVRQLAPGDGALLLGRAAAQLAEGQGAQAIADLDAVVADNPLWFDGQAALARLRGQMGDASTFDAGYRRALAAMPKAFPLWDAFINFLIHVEHYGAAERAVGEARAAGCHADGLVLFEAICASELGDRARADHLFDSLAQRADIGIAERHIRHLLRTGRADAAASRVEPHLGDRQANRIWPYAALAWRLTGDARWQWLEGDPALVGVVDLDVGDLLAPLAERLRAIHRAVAAPPGQSVRGGTQTDGPLFARDEPEIRRLRAIVVAAVEAHVAAMGPRDPQHPLLRHTGKRFRFAGSWSVRLMGAGHHSNHIHPQGWLSSAFYVALPSQSEMGPPPAGSLQLGAAPHELGLDLAPLRTIEPRPARLVLFPSIMWHGTQPILGGERLTVAFDVTPVG